MTIGRISKVFLDAFKRSLRSTTLWTLLLLFVADGAVYSTVPLVKEEAMSKFASFLYSQRQPGVLIVGSSVAGSAAYGADTTIDPRLPRDRWDSQEYEHSIYFQNRLAQLLGRNLEVFNLSTAGCMTSDVWLLLSRAFEFGKKPEIVVYELIPRDMSDANIRVPGATPLSRALARLHPRDKQQSFFAPIAHIFDSIAESPLSTNLQSVVRSMFALDNQSFCRSVDQLISSYWYVYKIRSLALSTVQSSEMRFLRPDSAANSAVTKPIDTGLVFDERSFANRYELEKLYLEKLLKLCSDHDVRLVLVNMPVTANYKSSVSNSLLNKYWQDIRKLARQYNVDYINLDDSQFAAQDFVDHIHVSPAGGKKVAARVADALAAQTKAAAKEQAPM
jgi:RNase H-fold protein (predicted Holliday junction resolvase)